MCTMTLKKQFHGVPQGLMLSINVLYIFTIITFIYTNNFFFSLQVSVHLCTVYLLICMYITNF